MNREQVQERLVFLGQVKETKLQLLFVRQNKSQTSKLSSWTTKIVTLSELQAPTVNPAQPETREPVISHENYLANISLEFIRENDAPPQMFSLFNSYCNEDSEFCKKNALCDSCHFVHIISQNGLPYLILCVQEKGPTPHKALCDSQ